MALSWHVLDTALTDTVTVIFYAEILRFLPVAGLRFTLYAF